jgi:hypothetical protein
MTDRYTPFGNLGHPIPAPRLTPEASSSPNHSVQQGRDIRFAPMPANAGLRPVLIAGVIAASLLGSSLIGIQNGFGLIWLILNAGLNLAIAAWLLNRPGGATAGPFSAGMLTATILVVYGSWAPALAAGERFSPLVPSPVNKGALEYTTAAALAVVGGVVVVSSIYAAVRNPRNRVNRRPAVPPRQWWRGVLLMEAFGLCCFVAFKVSSHQPVISFDLFRPLPAGFSQSTTSGAYLFLSVGIDVSIGAAIAASGLLGLKTYRLRVLALIVLNLFLYSTIGFKYRIVITLIGVFAVRSTTRSHKGRPAPRSQRIRAVLAAVVLTAVAFFVVQVYRGSHESSSVVTASSFDISNLENIVATSIDIATPYAAVHQVHSGLLLGESYLQLPRLFVPEVITGSKPLPAFILMVREATIPGTGAATPLWAEADANFGVIGLIGFGAILGWVVSRLDTVDRGRMESVTTAAAAGVVLASVLSRSLMFFAVYEFAAIAYPTWILGRTRPARSSASEQTGANLDEDGPQAPPDSNASRSGKPSDTSGGGCHRRGAGRGIELPPQPAPGIGAPRYLVAGVRAHCSRRRPEKCS